MVLAVKGPWCSAVFVVVRVCWVLLYRLWSTNIAKGVWVLAWGLFASIVQASSLCVGATGGFDKGYEGPVCTSVEKIRSIPI